MVLTHNKKLLLLAMAFFFNSLPAFPWTSVSGLIQYGENIDRERLKLLEDRQVMSGGYYDTFMTGTYIIRNAGDEYHATLGLLITGHQGSTVGVLSEVYFYVDGRLVPHTYTEDVSGFVMGETRVDFRFIRTSWVLIDALFPANSTVTIQVSYRHIYGDGGYNAPSFSDFLNDNVPNLFQWGGSPSFSVEIINNTLHGSNVERTWISNIIFRYIGDWSGNIDTMVYLQSMQGLETDLMKIQRPNGNTIRIEFTQAFLNSFHRSLLIQAMPVGEFRIHDGRQYFYFPHRFPEEEGWVSREIHLQFLDRNQDFPGHPGLDRYMNITRRVLAPYELIFLTASQLRIMRNAFFARHGFIFQSEDLRNFFGSLTNYQPNPNFHARMLTDIDRTNIATIQRLEALVGD